MNYDNSVWWDTENTSAPQMALGAGPTIGGLSCPTLFPKSKPARLWAKGMGEPGDHVFMAQLFKFSDLFPTDFPYSKSQPEYWDSNSHLQSSGTLTHVTRVLVFEPTSPECWDSKPHLQSNFCSPVIVVCSFGRCAPSLECSKSQLACRSC